MIISCAFCSDLVHFPSSAVKSAPSPHPPKKFLAFSLKKTRSEKISYILSKKCFSYILRNGKF